MLHGPLLGKILVFAFQLVITSCLQQLFNSADSAVLGQVVSNEALAAVGSTAPIINLIVNTFVGLSIGANVAVAVRVARGKDTETRDAVHTSMMVSLICGLALVGIGIAATNPMLAAIATPENVVGPAGTYLRIYFCGAPFILIYNFGSAVLRGKGDTRTPLYALAIACLTNVGLDLLLTLVIPWGIAGVALGTVVSYGIAAGLVVRVMIHADDATKLELRRLRMTREPLAVIMKIGVPAGLQGAVFAFSNLVIQFAINGFGSDAMAGSAAALNLEVYAYFVVASFAQTAVTFVGQNYALYKYDRCRKIFVICMVASVLFTGVLCLAYVVWMGPLLALFTTDTAALDFGITRMWHVGVIEFILASYEVSAGALRGMGISLMPAVITIGGTCVLRIIWVGTVAVAYPTFDALMSVYPVSWVVTGIAVLAAYALMSRKKLRATPAAAA